MFEVTLWRNNKPVDSETFCSNVDAHTWGMMMARIIGGVYRVQLALLVN